MSGSTYKKLSRAIARDDKNSIETRWAFGRKILDDPAKMSASKKSLRNGATEALIADASSVGAKLSAREIQYRLQCARAYATLAQLRRSSAEFADWSALVEAGFPLVGVDETPSPDDVLDDIEDSAPEKFEQLGLFPDMVKNVPLERTSLRSLVAYAEEMRRMTESYARRDHERQIHLNELCAAALGDLDVLYPDAVAMLAARTDAAHA